MKNNSIFNFNIKGCNVEGRNQGDRIAFSDFKNDVLVRKNNDFAECKIHLIHWKQNSLLHNTVLILCNEWAGLVAEHDRFCIWVKYSAPLWYHRRFILEPHMRLKSVLKLASLTQIV